MTLACSLMLGESYHYKGVGQRHKTNSSEGQSQSDSGIGHFTE
jgi:hypothetical protein